VLRAVSRSGSSIVCSRARMPISTCMCLPPVRATYCRPGEAPYGCVGQTVGQNLAGDRLPQQASACGSWCPDQGVVACQACALWNQRNRAWWRRLQWSQRAAWPGGSGWLRAAASSRFTSWTLSGIRPGSRGGGSCGLAGGGAWALMRFLSRAAVTAQMARAATSSMRSLAKSPEPRSARVAGAREHSPETAVLRPGQLGNGEPEVAVRVGPELQWPEAGAG